jgi:hypothetical protein
MKPRFMWLLTARLLIGASVSLHAEPVVIHPSIGRVEVTAELPKEAPYVGEPIVLRIRSSVHATLALERIVQPNLTDFDWQQFGIDLSSDVMIDGLRTPVVERVLLVTPLKAGNLIIPPFVRHVTIVTENNERVEADFASAPLEIHVRSHDGLGHASDWWLPAKSVKITDQWEPAPDKIPLGQTALRTLSIEAAGTTAERLPPPPAIKAPGLIAFPDPVERQTIVTDDGPVARVVYRWNVRPISAKPAAVPAIHIPWFDIAGRRMREAVTPAREVSFLDSTNSVRPSSGAMKKTGPMSAGPLVVSLSSFVWTLAVIFLVGSTNGPRGKWGSLFEQRPKAILQLKRAARKNDIRAFRSAVDKLSRSDRDRWRRVSRKSDVEDGLARINASLFSKEPASSPRLATVAKIIANAWRQSAL